MTMAKRATIKMIVIGNLMYTMTITMVPGGGRHTRISPKHWCIIFDAPSIRAILSIYKHIVLLEFIFFVTKCVQGGSMQAPAACTPRNKFPALWDIQRNFQR